MRNYCNCHSISCQSCVRSNESGICVFQHIKIIVKGPCRPSMRQKKQRSTFVRLISTKQAVEFILVKNSTATSTLHLQNFPLCLLVEQVSKTHRIA